MKAAWSTKMKQLVFAKEFDSTKHGYVQCMDPICRVAVIYNRGGEKRQPYFKTTGHVDSQHHSDCGFFEKLDPLESIEKTRKYKELMNIQLDDHLIIDLNLNLIDPDRKYQEEDIESSEEESPTKDKDEKEKKSEDEKRRSRCQSVKTVMKLLLEHTPDELSTIFFNIPKRGKVSLSSLITTPDAAHRYLWESDDANYYFVIGRIKQVIRREKVIYIPFHPVGDTEFSLVVFSRHFPHFTYKDENLKDRYCLAYGRLKKNDYRKSTEMIIKSNDYLSLFGKRKKMDG